MRIKRLASWSTVRSRQREENAGEEPRAGQPSMRVLMTHPACSGGLLVLVQGSSESVSSADLKVSDLPGSLIGAGSGRSGLLQRSVQSMLGYTP